MNDDQIHRALRQAPARISLPGSFNREVWARIEAEASLTLASCLRDLGRVLFAWLARPVPATLTIALFLVIGAVLGEWGSVQPNAAANEMAYIESISPFLHPRLEDMR